jgi:hypothetical protein
MEVSPVAKVIDLPESGNRATAAAWASLPNNATAHTTTHLLRLPSCSPASHRQALDEALQKGIQEIMNELYPDTESDDDAAAGSDGDAAADSDGDGAAESDAGEAIGKVCVRRHVRKLSTASLSTSATMQSVYDHMSKCMRFPLHV